MKQDEDKQSDHLVSNHTLPDHKLQEPLALPVETDNVEAVPQNTTRKEFKFIKPIDDIYDEKNTNQVAETFVKKPLEDDIDNSDEAEEIDDDSGEEPKQRGKGCIFAIICTAIVVAIAGILAAFLISAFLDYTALGRADKKVNLLIPKKSSVVMIANDLKEAGLISNPIAFRLYAKVKHVSGLQYGTYTLNTDMGYDDIITSLQKPAAKRQTIKITIPEGKTLQWIDQKLADNKVCDKNEFITACQKGGFKFAFDSQIPKDNKDRFYKYEGYLFPDTYEFYTDWTGKAAAQKLLDNFNVKFDDKLKARAAEIGMTVDQVITLASIIQAETGNVQQMSHVSSVFHNRLANGVAAAGGKKLLQSDATIYYATKDIQPVLQQASTSFVSAYNTYLHEGLTPGPICNPGMDAIHAALYPDNTGDYYFVTDSNSKYYYAATYSAHAANVQTALRTNSAKGTDVFK